MLLFEKMLNGLNLSRFFFLHKILNGFFGMFQRHFAQSLCALAKIRFEYTVSDENWIMYKVSELLESIRFISKATFQSIPSNSIETHWANSVLGGVYYHFLAFQKFVRLFNCTQAFVLSLCCWTSFKSELLNLILDFFLLFFIIVISTTHTHTKPFIMRE